MKRIFPMVVVLFMALAIAGNCEAKGSAKSKPPQKPSYWKIDSVDTANFALTVSKVVDPASKSKPGPPIKYTITTFTKVIIAGNPGKFEDLKPGMKVLVGVASGGVAIKIDADEAPPEPKKDEPKKDAPKK